RFAFETWIVPKTHNQHFRSIDDKRVDDMALILKDTLMRLKNTLKDPPYNFIIHTAPVRDGANEEFHWHLEIMPKLTNVAGFEWGSGFYINPTSPELAAKYLREGLRCR
ncbi:galactose-1-phosphate uridylyltransferase, partial [Candidatus Omnitrophota bacterium]